MHQLFSQCERGLLQRTCRFCVQVTWIKSHCHANWVNGGQLLYENFKAEGYHWRPFPPGEGDLQNQYWSCWEKACHHDHRSLPSQLQWTASASWSMEIRGWPVDRGSIELPSEFTSQVHLLDLSGCRGKRLKIVAYARKIRFNWFGVDVAALEGDIVAEGFRSGVDRKVMEFAESEVRTTISVDQHFHSCLSNAYIWNNVQHLAKKVTLEI